MKDEKESPVEKVDKTKGEEAVENYRKTMKKGKKWPKEKSDKTAAFLDKKGAEMSCSTSKGKSSCGGKK